MTNLTQGSVVAMLRDPNLPSDFKPIVQLNEIHAVGARSDRYKLIISDGEEYISGMLATQHNRLVESGELKQFTIFQITEYLQNKVRDKVIVVVLNLEIVGHHFERIGDPKDAQRFVISNSFPSSNAMTAAQPMYNRTNTTAYANGRSNGNGNGNNSYGSSQQAKATSSVSASSSSSNPYGNSAPRVSVSSAPIIRQSDVVRGVQITPISSLNMYQNRWTIRARVTSKSDVRTWSNARGEGCLFSIELLDSSMTDIKATFFKEAVDKFYHMIEENKVYTLSGGRLKVANQQYNTCKSNFEVTFDQNSEIHLVDDTGDIQQQVFEFKKVADLEATPPNTTVDILVVVKHVSEPATLISKKSGNELTKCDLTCVDDSGAEINLTCWGEKANRAPTEFAGNPIVAFRRVRVSDYGGRSLSTTTSGGAIKNPDVPEVRQLQSWWQSGGANATRSLSSSSGGGGKMATLAERKPIQTIKSEHLGMNEGDKPDWISFKGYITFLKKDKEGGAWYPACFNAEEPCKNRFKVTQTTDGNWYCDKCTGTYPRCIRRWIFSGTVADETSTTWVSFFNEQAEKMFDGVTADQVYEEVQEDQDKYDSHFAKANHTEWIFKCKVKQEMVGDEARVKTSVYGLHPVDYKRETEDLLDAIGKL